MRRWATPRVRYLLPAGLFLSGVAVAALLGWVGARAELAELDREQLDEVRAELHELQGAVQSAWLAGRVDRVREVLLLSASTPHTERVLLVDPTHTVAISSRLDEVGLASEVVLARLGGSVLERRAAADRAKKTAAAQSLRVDGDTFGVVPLSTAGVGTAPTGPSVLIIERDASRERALALRRSRDRALVMVGLTAGLAIAVMAALDYLLGRRLQRLVAATRRLALGDRGVRTALRGPDELGDLSRNFDAMAAEIDRRLDAYDAQNLVYDERERIAHNLHDTVIQRLFATGLRLESVAAAAAKDQWISDRIVTSVDEIDLSIKELRRSIFELTHSQAPRLAEALAALAAEYAETLSFEPELEVAANLDAVVTAEVAHHLLAICREALSNVLRHAKATRVWVTIGTDPLVARIEDDGVGIPESRARSSGLRNIGDRAARLGGRLVIERRQPSGTILIVELGPASLGGRGGTLNDR